MQDKLQKQTKYMEFQQIIPCLFIGGQVSSIGEQKMREAGIKHVLRVNGITQNVINYERAGITFKVLDIDDMPDFDIEPFFDEAHKFIDNGIQKNEGVLVVCTAGISRSAAICISYLIKAKRMPYKEAFRMVKEARIYIQPNVGFDRILKAYGEKYGCELCDLEKKTHWFDQYAKKRFGKQLFRVVECDSCECPMIVYIGSHKQVLEVEEIIEAFNLCEDVGNDKFGQGHWFIEGKQRKINDHFHWHVRELKMVNDILPIRILGQDPQIGQSIQSILPFSLDDVKRRSFDVIAEHLPKDTSFHILEKRVQRGLAIPKPTFIENQHIVLSSKVRFSFEGIWAIEQTVILQDKSAPIKENVNQVSMLPLVLATIYYRVLVNNKKTHLQDDHILAKL